MTRNSASKKRLRSQEWFDRSDDPGLTALYLERFQNYGLTLEELRSGQPVIGIAQTGSDLTPCNRHHTHLAKRVREGIFSAGGLAIEFPVHPIFEQGKRPTAALDRNLAYLGLVELLYGYPFDGVVLLTGCDKTTPACLMAAATVNIPSIALSVGPMLNGWYNGERMGSGSIIWKARELLAAGEIDDEGFLELVSSSSTSVGYCNTMGTAGTMNSLTEVMGMQLPGSAAIPAAYRERGQMSYRTGRQIIEMVEYDVRPSDIMTREAFENAIVANTALGGSTNAPIHLNAIARHLGIELTNDDWERLGKDVPLLVNLQPSGKYLGEDFFHAGGVPAIVSELLHAGRVHGEAKSINGRTLAENNKEAVVKNSDVIRSFDSPLQREAGFINMKGNIFDSALMKTSVISEEFRERYLSTKGDENAFEGRAIVFDGPEDYRARIDDPELNIDEHSILFMRGTGPIGYPGSAEVVNMQPPSALLKKGIQSLPCIGDGRQSGTSASPSILNASPEAAVLGDLALVRTGDTVRIDLSRAEVNLLVTDEEIATRREQIESEGGYRFPESQTPWQEIHRALVSQLDEGMVLKLATHYRDVARRAGMPRDNH